MKEQDDGLANLIGDRRLSEPQLADLSVHAPGLIGLAMSLSEVATKFPDNIGSKAAAFRGGLCQLRVVRQRGGKRNRPKNLTAG